MSESSQATRLVARDPVRVVYHAGDRTFARLFNERSLEDVKDVVRQKLGLGAGTDVSLKQIGSGTLLDLDDDGDFQAFRVFVKSCTTVDIEVTVGKSRDLAPPPPVAPKPTEQTPTSKPTTTASPSRATAGIATPARPKPSTRPEVAHSTDEASITPTMKPLARKRSQPSNHVEAALPDKPADQCSGQSGTHPEVLGSTKSSTTPAKKTVTRMRSTLPDRVAVTASEESSGHSSTHPEVTRNTEASVVPRVKRAARIHPPSSDSAALDKLGEEHAVAEPNPITPEVSASDPVGVEEPPKKRPKKTTTSVKKTLASESKPRTSKPSVRKVRDAEDDEISGPLAKKQRKQKTNGSLTSNKSSSPGDQDEWDRLMNQLSRVEDDAPLQLAGPSTEDGTRKTRKSETTKAPTTGVCASIPQTSASVSVQSEVAAAILSCCLSGTSMTLPPKTPAKRKSIARVTKKLTASSRALPRKSTIEPDAPANKIPNSPLDHVSEREVLTNEQQAPTVNRPPCPICLGEPFHIRYYCPTVLKGPDAIRERLDEVRRIDTGGQQLLILQLEGLLRDPKVTPVPPLDAGSADGVRSGRILSPPDASLSGAANVPGNSHLSEVPVEDREEVSSSESSETSEGDTEHQESVIPQGQKTPDEQLLPSNDDLEAVMRGPTSKSRSILNLLDRIVGDEDHEDFSSEEDESKLEEDPDEEISRSRRRLPRRIACPSDSESEESRSPSPSYSEDTSNNHVSVVQSSDKPTEVSAKQEGVVVTRDSVDSRASERQDGDGSEETYVGSEDRMVLDVPTGVKDVPIVAEERPSFPVPRTPSLQPPDALSHEPQESSKNPVDRIPNRDSNELAAPEAHGQAEVDPIETAEDLAPPTSSRSPNPDPIEVPLDDIGSLFASVTQSAPNPGVSKRIRTRNGETLDNEAERPVLVDQLAAEVTPLSAMGMGKPKRGVVETPTSQEAPSTTKHLRFSSPPTSTPAAVVLLNHKSKSAGKAVKTPAKGIEAQPDLLKSGAMDDAPQNEASIIPTLARWETLTEPSSPSVQPDEPPVLIDELMPSPQQDDVPVRGRLDDKEKKRRPLRAAAASEAETPKDRERLFDLSASQIPFPYSQRKNLANPEPALLSNGKEGEETSESDDSEPSAVKVAKATAKMPVRYRPLSQLASQASLFSPSFPTPTNKLVTYGKMKKRVVDEDSSSSSSSDPDEADGSEHIPRGRRAGSSSETKKRSLLTRI